MKNTVKRSITDKFNNMELKRKLVLVFYIQIIMPVFLIGFLTYNKAATTLREKSLSYSKDILRMIDTSITMFAEDIDSVSMQLMYDDNIYDYLNGYDRGKYNDYYSGIKTNLREVILSRKGVIRGIYLIKDKEDFIYYDIKRIGTNLEDDISYDYVYDKALKNSGNMCWIVDKDDINQENVYCSRIIYNRDNYKPIGTMVILFEKSYIESMYRKISPDEYNNIAILDNDENVVIKSNEINDGNEELLNQVTKNEEGYVTDEKSKMLVSYLNMSKPDWTVVYCKPINELYIDIDNLRIEIVVITIVSILLLSIISSITSRNIVKPINTLVIAMKKLDTEGKYEKIENNRNDEIGYLMKTFNTMAYNIDYLVNINYKERLLRKETQMKALQSQINPHFIFNTLENINWLAQLNGVEEISTTVTALANIMEAGIGRGKGIISLKEEMVYVDSFIDIFQVRFSDRLKIEKDISEDTLLIKVPKLIVEPVVENALSHGIEQVSRIGILEIKSYLKEEDLIIEVNDNGIGMTEDELEKLIDKIEGSTEEENENSSIGLRNVNKRLKLLYGDEYGISIESKYNEYTKVTLKLNREYKKKEEKSQYV